MTQEKIKKLNTVLTIVVFLSVVFSMISIIFMWSHCVPKISEYASNSQDSEQGVAQVVGGVATALSMVIICGILCDGMFILCAVTQLIMGFVSIIAIKNIKKSRRVTIWCAVFNIFDFVALFACVILSTTFSPIIFPSVLVLAFIFLALALYKIIYAVTILKNKQTIANFFLND